MMDLQQAISLLLVAAAVFFLARRYVRSGGRKQHPRCADCVAASMRAPEDPKHRTTVK